MRPIETLRFYLAAIIITIISITACSSGANKQIVSDANKAETAVTQKIRVALWDYDIVEYDKKLIEAYRVQHPDTFVDVVSLPGENYFDKLSIMLANDEDIDVIYLKDPYYYKKIVGSGQLLPLNDYIARDSIDLKPYGGNMEDIMKFENKIYGIPYRSDIFMLFYNKDIFDQKKVAYPPRDITWEELREIAQKITSGQGNDKIYGVLSVMDISFFQGAISQKLNDIDLLHSDLSELKSSIEFIMNMQADQSSVDPTTYMSLNFNQRTFEKGNTAMFINGSWFMNYLYNDKKTGKIKLNWGMTSYPLWKDGKKHGYIKYTPVCINSRTSKPEAAWSFLKFITGKDGAKVMAQEMMMPSYKDTEILNMLYNNPDFPKGSEGVLETGNVPRIAELDRTTRMIQVMAFEEITKIMSKTKSLDQGISDIIKKRKEIIDGKN